MRRIPRIKFPQRHPKSSDAAGSASQTQAAPSTENVSIISASRSDVPAPPSNMAVGGQASLQPKRSPVSDKEIEAILLGGCF
ncbi:uncharacterized protein LOC115677398 [Syzygium oleosum]|uniref:uncharacterized protein LOC115677398 n=1 Tax=Syzygium oleosum TaxID=219896 RepID=UPI0011D186F7|nr:uncharacterized protein LOC115677398 [Syzygium oleosum]